LQKKQCLGTTFLFFTKENGVNFQGPGKVPLTLPRRGGGGGGAHVNNVESVSLCHRLPIFPMVAIC